MQCCIMFQTIVRCSVQSQDQLNLFLSAFAMPNHFPYHIKQLCESPCCTATTSKCPHGNHHYQFKVRKPVVHVDFKPFNYPVQQHDNTEPTKSNTTKQTRSSLNEYGIGYGPR